MKQAQLNIATTDQNHLNHGMDSFSRESNFAKNNAVVNFNKRAFKNLDIDVHASSKSVWCTFNENASVCFDRILLKELEEVRGLIGDYQYQNVFGNKDTRFLVLSSNIKDIFSLGGDLSFFKKAIESNNHEALYKYGKDTMELVYGLSTGYLNKLHSVAAVNGLAYGGGFEYALAADHIIASTNARFCFPEVMFNMFPGMGAFTLLKRRISMKDARKLIMSAKTYSAADLYDMGVIDNVVAPEELEGAVFQHIRDQQHMYGGLNAFQQAINSNNLAEYEEMTTLLSAWVKQAFNLDERDLRKLKQFNKLQNKKYSSDDYSMAQ